MSGVVTRQEAKESQAIAAPQELADLFVARKTHLAVPAGLPRFARYLRSMRVAPDGKALTIEDEVGCVYRVDLASHASERISEPVG